MNRTERGGRSPEAPTEIGRNLETTISSLPESALEGAKGLYIGIRNWVEGKI